MVFWIRGLWKADGRRQQWDQERGNEWRLRMEKEVNKTWTQAIDFFCKHSLCWSNIKPWNVLLSVLSVSCALLSQSSAHCLQYCLLSTIFCKNKKFSMTYWTEANRWFLSFLLLNISYFSKFFGKMTTKQLFIKMPLSHLFVLHSHVNMEKNQVLVSSEMFNFVIVFIRKLKTGPTQLSLFIHKIWT